MTNYRVSHPTGILDGELEIAGSKSIHQRLMILEFLSEMSINYINPSSSNDVKLLQRALNQIKSARGSDKMVEIDIEDSGTGARFLTALLTQTPGKWRLKGTPRLHQRPMADLLKPLLESGAQIECEDQPNHLPLLISGAASKFKEEQTWVVDLSRSSQFASALVLISPFMSENTRIELMGELRSVTYLKLTTKLLEEYGVEVDWRNERVIKLRGKPSLPERIIVEPDWSSLGYWCAFTHLASRASIKCKNTTLPSIQGDSWILDYMNRADMLSYTTDSGLHLKREDAEHLGLQSFDFSQHPDLAPTLIVLCSLLPSEFYFFGVESLRLKESDRLQALFNELKKVGITFFDHARGWVKEGEITWPETPPRFQTYGDHRMAMAFALMGIINPVEIEEIEVVKKSYPEFWDDLRKFNFVLDAVD